MSESSSTRSSSSFLTEYCERQAREAARMWRTDASHNHDNHGNYNDHSTSSSSLFDSYNFFSGSNLPPSSQLFLQALRLPILHPFCAQLTTRPSFDHETLLEATGNSVASTSSGASPPPPLGPLLPGRIHTSRMDALITWCWMWIPPWIAFIDLWIRLLSGVVAPLCVVYLAWMEYQALKQRYMLRMTTRNHTITTTTASAESSQEEDTAKQHEAIKEKKDPRNEMDRRREENQVTTTNTTNGHDDYPYGGFSSPARMYTTLATACLGSLIIMTDSMYVMEYGPQYGVSLFVTALLLSMRVIHQYSRRKNDGGRNAVMQRSTAVAGWIMVGCILVMAGWIVWDPTTRSIQLGQAEEVRIRIPPGLYYNPNNDLVQRIIQHWPVSLRTYGNDEALLMVPPTLFTMARRKKSPNATATGVTNLEKDNNNQHHFQQRLYPTPWMYTGDARTGLPYVLNRIPELDWKRVFLTVQDGEVLALDIAFPPTGYNASNPLYMILHGANGGTDAEYVVDLAWRRTRESNATVVVMVSRGLMDVPLRGWDIYDASRWSDAHETAVALRRAAELSADVLSAPSCQENSQDYLRRLLVTAQRRHGRRFRHRHRRDPVILAGVGYSMGAIVLNNYVASAGRHCALDAAFSISGAMECRAEQYFARPQRLWQPMIAHHIRAQQHLAKFGQRIQARLGVPATMAMMRVTTVVDLDQHVTADYYRDKYHSNISEYYTAASALGDLSLDELHHHAPPLSSLAHTKIANVSIPLCVLHAFDDPISTWRTIVANDGLMHPERLVQVGQGNLVLLLTASGGHVGWPLGWLPTRHNWKFMSDAAGSFVDAVAQAKRGHP